MKFFSLAMKICIGVVAIQIISNSIHANHDYLFVHGLGGDHTQYVHYLNNHVILGKPCYAYDGPEISLDFSCVALGQKSDINAILKGLNRDNALDKSLIGVGVSKGASTLINAVATNNFSNIKALVLESPFCNANDVGYNVAYPLQLIPGGYSCIKTGMELRYPNYQSNGLQPITSAKKISPSLPIFIFHSQQDGLIPVYHSRKLYRELLLSGNMNVYLVETKTGRHAGILTDENKDEKQKTLEALHAFYKQYNLPFNPKFINPATNLHDYQPSLDDIEKLIASQEPGSFITNIGCCLVSLGSEFIDFVKEGFN